MSPIREQEKTMDHPTPDLADLHRQLTSASVEARRHVDELRGVLAEKVAARGRALTAAAPRAELLANLERLTAELRTRWIESHGRSLLRELSGSISVRVNDRGQEVRTRLRPRLPVPDDRTRTETLELLAAAGLYRDVVEATAAEEGVPDADRETLLARLDAEIADLEAREEALILNARSAGVLLARRPAVQDEMRLRAADLRAQRDKLRGTIPAAERAAVDRGRTSEFRARAAAHVAALRAELGPVETALAELEAVL